MTFESEMDVHPHLDQGGSFVGGADTDDWGDFVAYPSKPEFESSNFVDQSSNYKKGDNVLYHDRSGQCLPCKIVSVDQTISPPSYGIELNGAFRETEGFKLRPIHELDSPSMPIEPPTTNPVQEEEEDDGFGDFESAAATIDATPQPAIEPTPPPDAVSVAASPLTSPIEGASGPLHLAAAPQSKAAGGGGGALPADLFSEISEVEEEHTKLDTAVDTLNLPLGFGSVINLAEMAGPSSPRREAVSVVGLGPHHDIQPALPGSHGVDFDDDDDDDFGDFEAADEPPAAPTTRETLEAHKEDRNGVATSHGLPLEAGLPATKERTAPVEEVAVGEMVPVAAHFAAEDQQATSNEEHREQPHDTEIYDAPGIANGHHLADDWAQGGNYDFDDFGDFEAAPTGAVDAVVALEVNVQPQIKEDPVFKVMAASPVKQQGTSHAIPSQSAYQDYPVVWTRLLQEAAILLSQGRTLWSEACSASLISISKNQDIDIDVDRVGSEQVSLASKLLCHAQSTQYLAALGRVYFTAAVVRLAADQFGFMGLMDDLREAWEACTTAWGCLEGKGAESAEGPPSQHHLHSLGAAVYHATCAAGHPPLELLLKQIDAAEATIPSLPVDAFPRVLAWSEGLDAVTLLPLDLFQEVSVRPWISDRPCMTHVANLWIRCVSKQQPDLD